MNLHSLHNMTCGCISHSNEPFHYSSPQWVSMNIIGKLKNVGIIFDQNTLETPLKQMAGSKMTVIESSSIGDSDHNSQIKM